MKNFCLEHPESGKHVRVDKNGNLCVEHGVIAGFRDIQQAEALRLSEFKDYIVKPYPENRNKND